MVFFFFGGMRPEVSKVVESGVAECPHCGSDAALVEYDNVFRAFFLPVWRWAGTNPAIHCDNCSLPLEEFQKLHSGRRAEPPRLEQGANGPPPRLEQGANGAPDLGPSAPLLRCWACISVLQPEFRYCPHCGVSQQ